MSSAVELIESVKNLGSTVTELADGLRKLNPGLWDGWVIGIEDKVWRKATATTSNIPPHQQAANIYSCLHHLHSGDGRDTWQMAGLLMVPDSIIDLGNKVNESKQCFEKALFQYKYPGKSWDRRHEEKLPKKNSSLMRLLKDLSTSPKPSESQLAREVLSRLGSSRLHIRHCTRKIRILNKMPESISLSWVQQRKSIRKITADECLQKLNSLKNHEETDHGLEAQIAIVNSLRPEDIARLRLVQTVTNPSVKGKLYWSNSHSTELGYLSMPALIASGQLNGKLPDFTRLSETPPTTKRRRRKDSKLSPEPLLSSIRVYLSS